jgi:PadR family transcriptional regulator AphA
MFVVSADAKTSAGAPCMICAASAEEASKLNVTLAPGLALVNASPIFSNESVNDVAAKTVMLPLTGVAAPFVAGAALVVAGTAAVDAGAWVAGAWVAGAAVVPDELPPELPHAAASSPRAAKGTASRPEGRCMGPDRSSQDFTIKTSGTVYSRVVASAAIAARRERPAVTPDADPSLAEQVCLALTVQGLSHGWAIGTMLAPDGELGRIWSLSRPLTYRAIDGLVDRRLVTRRGQTAGHGRDRVLLAPTAAGRRVSNRWLATPVEHLRDVRTELLVKLFLHEQAGLDTTPLLAAQQHLFMPAIDALTSTGPLDDLVDLWRRESARAVRRFLAEALHPPNPTTDLSPEFRLSARNQLRGTVTAVQHGQVMSTVKAVVASQQSLTAAITKDAAADLDLAPGDTVTVIVKSTEVLVAKAS